MEHRYEMLGDGQKRELVADWDALRETAAAGDGLLERLRSCGAPRCGDIVRLEDALFAPIVTEAQAEPDGGAALFDVLAAKEGVEGAVGSAWLARELVGAACRARFAIREAAAGVAGGVYDEDIPF